MRYKIRSVSDCWFTMSELLDIPNTYVESIDGRFYACVFRSSMVVVGPTKLSV